MLDKLANIKEVYKDIPGYDGLYQASTFGNIRSLDKMVDKGKGLFLLKGRVLKPSMTRFDGYYQLAIGVGDKRKRYTVHTLVAMTFLNHTSNRSVSHVDHIDNDKLNNNISNLQIITPRENCTKDKKGFTSKYIGVCWHTRDKKWQASIKTKGKYKYLGQFINEESARDSYIDALNKLQC